MLTAQLFGQKITYYDRGWKEVPSRTEAAYYRFVFRDWSDDDKIKTRYYFASGQLKYSEDNDSTGKPLPNSKLLRWYANGQLQTDETRINGKLSDTLRTYRSDGKLKRLEIWKDGQFISGTCFDRQGNPTWHTSYIVEPEYPGGRQAMQVFIDEETKHPAQFLLYGVGGEAKVRLTVLPNGYLANFHVVEASDKEFAKEALRVVKLMPRWKPGMVDGNGEPWEMTLLIKFGIDRGEY